MAAPAGIGCAYLPTLSTRIIRWPKTAVMMPVSAPPHGYADWIKVIRSGLPMMEQSGRNIACRHESTEENMAFNNIGPLTFLAPGQTASWSYSYGDDHGTQFASADVKTPNQGAVHLADQQTKRKDNNGVATYTVNIHNLGAGGCFHNLQGGGMS